MKSQQSDKNACNDCGDQPEGGTTNLLHCLKKTCKDLAEECMKAEAERKGNSMFRVNYTIYSYMI